MKNCYRAFLIFVHIVLFGGVVCGQSLAASSTPDSPVVGSKADDARIVKLLVGKWEPPLTEEDLIGGIITYNADGTGSLVGGPLGRPELKIRLDFKWEVADGMLIELAVKATVPPGFPTFPLPAKSVDRVVSISERQMLREQVEGTDNTKRGKKELWNRVP